MKKFAKTKFLLSLFVSVLTVLFMVSVGTVQAAAAKEVDVITEFKIQNAQGEELATSLGRYDSFRLNAKFALEGKNVKAGDTTAVTIDGPIDIKSQDFEINDTITGKKIADAKVDAKTGKIVLTFTKFVEEKNDVSGSFFFYAGVNKDKFPNDGEVPFKLSVNGNVKFNGKVKSGTVGEGNRYTIIKSGWDNGDHKNLGFRISVNRTNEAINNAVLSDSITSAGVTYKKGSFKIFKGTWEYNGTWTLKNKQDVTANYTVNATDKSFSIDFGNISANDHFAVEYEAVANYETVDGEQIKNTATIKGDNKAPYDSNSKVNIQIAGGEGVGYEFSIQVKKVDENGAPLKGAKFQVIRQATGQVMGDFETDANGEFTLGSLLRDKYIIKETQAPEGYELAADTVVEASEFKTPKAPVAKNIVDQKTTTTTTTTTEEPTTTTSTTTTTTEEPTTTTSTTTPEEPTTTTSTTTTTTEEPTTTTSTTTTTTPEPTTTTTTTPEEQVVTETTTTPEEPVVSETTTPQTTMPYYPGTEPTTTPEEPTTTSTTTPEEPVVSETTTPEEPVVTETTETTSEKPAPSVSTTEEGSELPFTGEATGTVLVLAGLVILSGTVVMKRKFSK